MKLNPDVKFVEKFKSIIEKNNGYCPCMIHKSEDTKCPCRVMREQDACQCGLYVDE